MKGYPILNVGCKTLFMETLVQSSHRRFLQTFAGPVCQKWPVLLIKKNHHHSNETYIDGDKTSLRNLTTHQLNKLVHPFGQSLSSTGLEGSSLISSTAKSKLILMYLQMYQAVQSMQTSIASFCYNFSPAKKGSKAKGKKRTDQDDEESSDKDDDDPLWKPLKKEVPPLLMNFIDPYQMPGPFKSLSNFFTVQLIIKPFFDPTFTMSSFLEGAKQAVYVISDYLSKGEVESLEGLIDPEALKEIKQNIVKFTPAQLADLKVIEEEIIFFFTKEVGIIMEDERRFAEITVIFQVGKGLKEMMEKGPPNLTEQLKHMTTCNYRFIREYTKGVDGEWICNRLNHFKPGHFLP